MRAVVYGSRPDGHARVVIELLAGADGSELTLVGLVDDHPEHRGRRIGELEVVGTSADLARLTQDGVTAAILGFGAAAGRLAALDAIAAAALELPVLIHPTAHVAASARLAAGCQVLPGAIVGPGAVLGRGVLVNSGAIVEHDARLADAVVIDPGAALAGRVTVGAETEVGTGAVLLPDICVGARAIVGAGAVVTRDVPDDAIAVGVPARARPAQRDR